ncbi:hypothetical protein L484_018710 [Morus notabilis]|uniref:Wound-responsive family protein n=1 Tax=Morus notabilis TaxID=981085 RepID=W9S5D4_9ROSA|nr:uncharacterized protein LOC21401676 [Morus notabilis]EXB89609.1 hypothetical protein L484_018710 [Morus notabilis]
MASARRSALVMAASNGAVEALKDQLGVCRWNFVLRSLQQNAKSNIISFSQAKNNKFSSQYSSFAAVSKLRDETNLKQSEESSRKVMYLNCWGS